MAKRFRIDQGGRAGIGELIKGFASQFQGGDVDAALNAIESGDAEQFKKLFDNPAFKGRFREEDKSRLLGQFNDLQSKLPSSLDARKDYIKSISNEADASDEDLQSLLEAHKGIGSEKPNVDWNGVADLVRQKLDNYGVPRDLADKAIPLITDSMQKLGGRFDPNSIWQAVSKLGHPATGLQYGNMPGVMDNLSRAINNGAVAADLSERVTGMVNAPDTSADAKRIQDILAGRAGERNKGAAEAAFLVDTPEDLRKSRENFLAEQEEGLGKTLTERTAPQVLAELNARGLAESPDVISEISRRGASMQAGIEDQVRQLEQQDAQFFADAAFRIQTAKLNQKEADFRSSVDLERTRARSDQQNRFQTTQSRINSDFEMDMLRREQERNLRLGQDQLNFDSSSRSAAANAGNAADIGSSVGQIVGTKIGTKTGQAVVNNTPQNSTTTFDFNKGVG